MDSQSVRCARLVAAVSIAGLLVSSCAGLKSKVSRRFGGKLPFAVQISERLNEDFPVAVDLVVVYEKDLAEELKGLPAVAWFEKREQYAKDEGKALEIAHWEWVPGRPVGPFSVDYRVGAKTAVLYAAYFTSGDHREVIEPLKPFHLLLGETGFEIEPLAGKVLKAEKKKAKKAQRMEKKRKKAKPPDSGAASTGGAR